VDDRVILPLSERPDLVPTIAEWHRLDDGGRMPLEAWIEAHAVEARGADVPTAWVALIDGRPVGCVSLIASNMDTHPELTPWLAALYVVPDARRRGVGSALTDRCEAHAASLGYRTLFLYTERAEPFYAERGWRLRGTEEYEGQRVAVMEKTIR
jgi:GNAT superfamily N-acetyltransferase